MIIAEDLYPDGITFNHPWPFMVVDNFLGADSIKYLSTLQEQQTFIPLDGSNGKRTLLVTHKDAVYKKSTINFQNKTFNSELYGSLCKHISKENIQFYTLLTELVSCDPKYFYNKHVDHKAKLYSIVVYLEPSEGNGTVLLDKDDNEYEVKWVQNRALIFKYNSNAYHYYKNTTTKPRISLNVNIAIENAQFKILAS